MKRCLGCGASFPSASTEAKCPACGTKPARIDGFPAYAPDLARGSGGFKSHYFADLAPLEERNFWFRSRNRMIVWALEKYCPGFRSILEIGCGTGYVLSGIAESHPEASLHGSEIDTAGLRFAASRLPRVEFMQMDARRIPFVDEFDVIGAFDVLEHIDEDGQVLAQIHGALRSQGVMLLTVPQHKWLWGPLDEYACHVRRYSAEEIQGKCIAAGFDIVRTTSFVCTLLPAMMISRALRRRTPLAEVDATAELRVAPSLNLMFAKVLAAELVLIRRGLDLPAGGSRLVVARKR